MDADLSFEGKVVAITGAGAGLGRAYALELARRGASVVVNDLGAATDGSGADTRAAEEVAAEIEAAGGRATPNFDTVATEDGGRSITETALKTYGRIDALIANAGILRDRSFVKLTPADFDAVIAVHLRGAFFTAQPAFRAMKDRGEGGRIVFTTSPVALFGTFGQPNYVAAKLGVIGLTTSVAIEGRKANIIANCVAPMAATRLTPGMATVSDADHPFAPRRVAPLVTFLAHESCPSTGQVYVAGHNFHARAAMMLAPGWVASDDTALNAETIAAHWADINALSGAHELETAAAISPLLAEKTPFLRG